MTVDHEYTRELADGYWDLTTANLVPAVQAAFPGKLASATFYLEVAVLRFSEAVDQATLDALVVATKAAFSALPLAKAAAVQAIRDNTDGLIAQGAVYNDVVYMSTEEGRFDVLAQFATGVSVQADGSWVSVAGAWPQDISSTDGTTEENFPDADAYQPFFLMMVGTYKHWKNSGQGLRMQINDATTIAEVKAVVDDRTWPWVPA